MEILEDGLVILAFDFNGKNVMVSFQVFLDMDDGRSAIYVHNLGRDDDHIDYDFLRSTFHLNDAFLMN